MGELQEGLKERIEWAMSQVRIQPLKVSKKRKKGRFNPHSGDTLNAVAYPLYTGDDISRVLQPEITMDMALEWKATHVIYELARKGCLGFVREWGVKVENDGKYHFQL